MAELAPRERLQPSLLDRLTDDEADSQQESREKRVLSMRGLRRAVLRDLGWLLNSNGLVGLQDLADFPLAQESVVNFGFPDLTGRTASGLRTEDVEELLRTAIWRYEPRILPDTVAVRALPGGGLRPHQLGFEIEGELWGQPLPERFYLKTELDLEIGEIKIVDGDARGT